MDEIEFYIVAEIAEDGSVAAVLGNPMNEQAATEYGAFATRQGHECNNN